jgi:hypothetical protein
MGRNSPVRRMVGNVLTEDGEQDVDEEVSSAAALEEDTQRRKEDGKEDLADIASGESHVDGGFLCESETLEKVCCSVCVQKARSCCVKLVWFVCGMGMKREKKAGWEEEGKGTDILEV